MLTILIRTLIVYVVLICIMRLMGKRQIGELEVTDLVTTLLISEIASLPITNQEIPISYAVIPMITLLVLEVLSSVILIRFPRLKTLVSACPTVIIQEGHLKQDVLRELRVSIDELISEIRQQGYTDLSQIDTAILEKNGKMTVLPKGAFAVPTVQQLGVTPEEVDLMHIVYANNAISQRGLKLIGRDDTWLLRELKKQGLSLNNQFCITANRHGDLYSVPKERL